MYTIIEHTKKGFGYVDLTGRFPYISAQGNQYILVAYGYDSNAILVEPIKNRNANTITKAWEKIHKKFECAGVAPQTYVLDNEASNLLKAAMKEKEVAHQLVTPHNHRANIAERAIQTFKQHFKAILASVDPEFPIEQWDRLLNQAELTLNLLRSARMNPKLSAHAFINGEFNFQATPLAPPGTRVVAHTKPSVRGTWALHGEDGWYIGPALHHY